MNTRPLSSWLLPTKRRPAQAGSQARYYRPSLEPLEDRLAPALSYADLASGFVSDFAKVTSEVAVVVGQSSATLPILGQSFQTQADKISSNLNGLLSEFASNLQTALQSNTAESKIENALNRLSFVTGADVSNLNVQRGDITIELSLGKSFDLGGFAPPQFKLGIDGIPLGLTGNAALTVGLKLDWSSLKFGMRDNHFFVDTSTPSKLGVTLSANAQANLTGQLGFFNVTASPIPGSGLPTASLTAGLQFDVRGMTITPSPEMLIGAASVNMKLDTGFDAARMAPHLVMDFKMDWQLAGKHNAQLLGKAPTVQFSNVQLGLGSFVSNIVAPVIDKVRLITAPNAVVYSILSTPIPGLTQLSEAAGLGQVTLERLAYLAASTNVIPPEYRLLVELALSSLKLSALVNDAKLNLAKDDVLIPVGNFGFFGTDARGQDLRASTLTGGKLSVQEWFRSPANLKNISDLVPIAIGEVQNVENKILGGGYIKGPFEPAVRQVFTHIKEQLRKMQNGIGFRFPILENPMEIAKLLLGHDVDLVRFDAQFIGDAAQRKTLGVWGPVDVGFSGNIHFESEFHAGVDTFGLREFFTKLAGGGVSDIGLIDDGLWVDSSKNLALIRGGIRAEAKKDFSFGTPVEFFAYLGFSGGLEVPENNPFVLSFIDVNRTDTDTRLRLLRDGDVPGDLFKVTGQLNGKFDFNVDVGVRVDLLIDEIEFRKNVFHLPIAEFELINLQSIDRRNPVRDATTVETKIDIIMDANGRPEGNDGKSDSIVVRENGDSLEILFGGAMVVREKLKKINSVRIIGSGDDGRIDIHGVNRELTVDGGGGQDTLYVNDTNFGSDTEYRIGETLVSRIRRKGQLGGQVNDAVIYKNCEILQLDGSDARKNTFFIDNLAIPTAIWGGSNDDKFYLGGASHTLDTFRDSLLLSAGGGVDGLYLDDTGEDRLAAYELERLRIVRRGFESFDSPTYGRTVSFDHSIRSLLYHSFEFIDLQTSDKGSLVNVNFPHYAPMGVTVTLGRGDHTINLVNTSATVTVNAKNFGDVINVGAAGVGTLGINGDIIINGSATLNINDADSQVSRQISMSVDNNFNGLIYGFTYAAQNQPGRSRIRYNYWDEMVINIQGSNGANYYTVNNISIFAIPTITTGTGFNNIDVVGTGAGLTIDSRSTLNTITIGSAAGQNGNLSNIGGVTIRGTVASLAIRDQANGRTTSYVLDAAHLGRVHLIDGPRNPVFFENFATPSLRLYLGNGGNNLTIDGTPTIVSGLNAGVNIFTGNRSDIVQVLATGSPLTLNLGAGSYQQVSLGSDRKSLDAIRGTVKVFGDGFIDVLVHNEMAAAPQNVNIETRQDTEPYQVFERQQYNAGHYDTMNAFTFLMREGSLNYMAGQGGETIFVNGSLKNVTTVLNSGGGTDVFWIQGDTVPLLGQVFVYGNRAQNDFAYFYDYFAATPQTYSFRAGSNGQEQIAQRSGNAAVTYRGINHVVAYTGRSGGNRVNVPSSLASVFLNMTVASNDTVVVGDGDLSKVAGAVSITGGSNVALTLNDSASLVGRNATLHPADDAYGDSITGMAPGEIMWKLDGTSSIKLRGGGGNDTFHIDGTAFRAKIAIDGGAGVNTLDYSDTVNLPGLVSWYRFEGDFKDSFGSNGGSGAGGLNFGQGVVGTALFMDGVSGLVEIPSQVDLSSSSLTLEVWVKPTRLDGQRVIVSKYDSTRQNGLDWMLWTQEGRVHFGVFQGAAARVVQSATLTLGRWQHIAATFDPVKGNMQVYIDGFATEVTFAPGADAIISAINYGPSPVRIGAAVGDGGTFGHWAGGIDELGIHNRAMTASEVEALAYAESEGRLATAQGVRVDLKKGTASGLAGGIAKIQNVIGSAFNDILIGNGGNALFGGAGRDILVAGAKASYLYGDGGDDVLIGGSLRSDVDQAALDIVMADWAREDVDYTTRAAKLQTQLAGKVVKNTNLNQLFGNDEMDLFFGKPNDIMDRTNGERLVVV